jgi:Pregnancy-associated plasma protein-A
VAKTESPKVRSCGTMEVHERLLRTVPDYADARAESETRAWRFATGRSLLARTGVTVIPVVVHVVHKTSAQDISDAQIQSQIDVLNRDYRKTNPDASATPAAFSPLVADARVEFELATTDPNGAATNGIDRVATTTDTFSNDDHVKASATGGADPWPSDRYLNLWVCQLGGGLLGYAQFPGGPTDTDGVVILHSGFGTTGTAAAPFNLGRTATHEIGHWLNLRHIWGDDGTGCNGSDFVNDTPNAAGPNYGAPAFPHVTCMNGANGDLFMNYMDYVDDAAMVMFTNDQVTRMQACLDADRASIGTTKAGPTLKFADEPLPTIKTSDEPIGSLKFRDEPLPTIKTTDEPIGSLKFRDEPLPTLKILDEPVGTLKFRDEPGGTMRWIDEPGGTVPWIDTIKQPFFDKNPSSDSPKPSSDVQTFPSPAPFVLSTPHHSMAWTQSFPGAQREAVTAYARQIGEYEDVLSQYAQAEMVGQLGIEDREAGDRLYGDYVRLIEEYRQLTES